MFAAREQGIPLPNLFTDASFHTFSTVTLSTTHPNPTPGVDGIGFGPVSERCIGVSYFVFENEIIWFQLGRVRYQKNKNSGKTDECAKIRPLSISARSANMFR